MNQPMLAQPVQPGVKKTYPEASLLKCFARLDKLHLSTTGRLKHTRPCMKKNRTRLILPICCVKKPWMNCIGIHLTHAAIDR
jgi:hypothetical protein